MVLGNPDERRRRMLGFAIGSCTNQRIGDNEVAVSTTNRNFKGRMGDEMGTRKKMLEAQAKG